MKEAKCKRAVPLFLAAVAVLAMVLLLVIPTGCGTPSTSEREETYRTQYKETMEDFFKRIEQDDKKAEELSKKGDNAGVMQLVNKRLENMSETMLALSKLTPTTKYLKLHAITLYFVNCLIEQLEAQNELNKASVSGESTTDLQARVQNAMGKVTQVGRELSVEQLSVGIVLEGVQTESTPQGKTEGK